jgi:ubiquinone/menaquinone biosynthesis C-methylase UbiE
MFSAAEAYEQSMGSWSRRLAPLFIEFIGGIGDTERVLDVGCGTGSLACTILTMSSHAKIVGIDPSGSFIEYARSKNVDPRITFEVGDAQQLPYLEASFDKCLALLIMSFISDAPKAAREMRRVTKPGGIVATAMWDAPGAGMELQRAFWNSVVALDPGGAERLRETQQRYRSAEALADLWLATGFSDVQVKALTISCDFRSFDEVWLYYTKTQGPAGTYVRGLSEDRQQALKERLRQELLGICPDRSISVRARAWAVRGLVPSL